jgi:hypothetical protein
LLGSKRKPASHAPSKRIDVNPSLELEAAEDHFDAIRFVAACILRWLELISLQRLPLPKVRINQNYFDHMFVLHGSNDDVLGDSKAGELPDALSSHYLASAERLISAFPALITD